MKREEILINATASEVRAALVESGVLQEVQIERASARGLVGNICMGRVVRVLPGMQSAFVEIGGGRAQWMLAGMNAFAALSLAGRLTGIALAPDLAYFVLFLPMVLVLVFLPQGLFGRVQL